MERAIFGCSILKMCDFLLEFGMATQNPRRPTTLVPVTELVEVPVLSKAEKDELIRSLEEAEAEIARGEGTMLKSGDLLAEYREHRSLRKGQ